MVHQDKPNTQQERFNAIYERTRAPVMRLIEKSVCGCDYGGNSWTNRDEADQIVKALALNPNLRVMDLGAGSGWPGLYIAQKTGCGMVLVDLPIAGLQLAMERAVEDGMDDRVWIARADGAALPFAAHSFDRISHSDLLCCLADKREVMADCRRVIRDGGRMAFTVISLAPGLSEDERLAALEAGPEYVDSDTDTLNLISETGWVAISARDISPDFADRCRDQLVADNRYRAELVELLGTETFEERQWEWQLKISTIEQGLLRRDFFVVEPA